MRPILVALTLVAGTLILLQGCRGSGRRSDEASSGSETDKVRVKCQSQLRTIVYAVIAYRADNEEKLPTSLEEALEPQASKGMISGLLKCPGTDVTLSGETSYVYVNWSHWFPSGAVPQEYPVVYESKSGGHGNGINVAQMNGTVFWDQGASWLSTFAKEHREYGLVVPKE